MNDGDQATTDALAEALVQLDAVYTPTKALRWIERDGERILQQKWECAGQMIDSIFRNLLFKDEIQDTAHEWRDVPVVTE